MENGLSKWKYVEVGKHNSDHYEILNGLTAGDTVIVEGNFSLAEDTKVNVESVIAY